MTIFEDESFKQIHKEITSKIIRDAYPVESKKWQAIDSPMGMRELLNVSVTYPIPTTGGNLKQDVGPNLPWSDLHFEERIGGIPLNPGESYKKWPFYVMDEAMRTVGDKFSHTYMERIWPKFSKAANIFHVEPYYDKAIEGIRYQYGDLKDVIELLKNDPFTRQAYLPIFFPEDTGNVMNQRIPCTIGYHFILRDGRLHIIYYIRSCDFVRHFKDDVYLACKLVQWILDKLRGNKDWENVITGDLTMHITSLHVFESDMYSIKKNYEKDNQR